MYICIYYNFDSEYLNTEVHCDPCKMYWIQNGTSCYFFWMNPAPWLTWGESQTRCTENKGHLVVIDTIEEQVSSQKMSEIHLTIKN